MGRIAFQRLPNKGIYSHGRVYRILPIQTIPDISKPSFIIVPQMATNKKSHPRALILPFFHTFASIRHSTDSLCGTIINYNIMFEKHLTYDDLDITDRELLIQMGYGEAEADDDTRLEIERMKERVRGILKPRFCFHIEEEGELDCHSKTLTTGGHTFGIGPIITSQLRGSEAYAFFVATSGMEFERLQRQLEEEGDMVRVFIADAMGSVIAEKTADIMERWLQVFIKGKGWKHTNRFSPGYCGWHVSEQQMLFSMLPEKDPCGVRLTDSSLMVPIKSVSGVTGLGREVKKLEYTCGLCNYAKCYKRRKRERK